MNPTTDQKKAFTKVANAIKAAKKAGLIFYGKSGDLVAYTKEAEDYVESHGFLKCLRSTHGEIPNISVSGLINDSGADDYPHFISKADEIKYKNS